MDQSFCLLDTLLEVVVLAGEGAEVLGEEVFLLGAALGELGDECEEGLGCEVSVEGGVAEGLQLGLDQVQADVDQLQLQHSLFTELF